MTTRTAIILSLQGPASIDGGERCGACGGSCAASQGSGDGRLCASGPRVPVLVCKEALEAHGYAVQLRTATCDPEIDAVIAQLDGLPRPDGLTWPAGAPHPGAPHPGAPHPGVPVLVVAAESDAQLRHVLRRMVRRYAPAPSKRPADLPDGRTIPDLPAIGVLPLSPAADASGAVALVERTGLPSSPVDVAKAIDGGQQRRLDLFRTDGGSVTIHGAMLGGVDVTGEAAAWSGHVIVDDTVLASPSEPVLACAIANANGYARLDEIDLAPAADASTGTVTVAVAVPIVVRPRFGRPSVRLEVRRATGRAVAVTPAADLPYADDGVVATLTRRRTWWVEPGAWSAYTL